MYLAHERRAYILRLLEARGSLRSAALARELRVTDETIRTDLVQLQAEGLLRRVHGGAVYTPPAHQLHAKDTVRLDVQLAQLIAESIPAGSRILVTDAPLIPALAACLLQRPCTFITPAPELLLQLAPHALPHHAECTGGALDKASGLLRSSDPEATLRRLQPDLALFTPPAVTPHSISYPHRLRADWARTAPRLGIPCLIAVPSAALAENNTPHPQARFSTELTPALLVTEDNLPPAFTEALPAATLRTVPYISRDSLVTDSDWEL